MKKLTLFILILLVISPMWAQVTSSFSLTAVPSVNFPLGPILDDGTAFYSLGGGFSLRGEYVLPFTDFLFAQGILDFDFSPINASSNAVTFLSAGAGAGLRFSPANRIIVKASSYGGIYMGLVEAGSVRNPFLAVAGDFSYLLNPTLNVGIGTAYKHFFTPSGPVYRGMSLTLGASFNLGAGKGGATLEVAPMIDPIFPLFYSYYDKNPAGEVVITNRERAPLQDVKLSFLVKQYMDQPKEFATVEHFHKGESLSLPVYALFTDNIFNVTEGTKVAGEIIVDYSYIGKEMTSRFPVTVTVNNRNAMSWDDDRKAAAFVTAKDPLILSFSKNIAGSLRTNDGGAVNSNFRTAMAIFEGLKIYGIGYVIDPSTPYSELSENTSAVDFLQFPNQTLAYKAGDCDDLTVLYCSLLESVGIETAFITAPGHIYMAFNLGMDPGSAEKLFASSADLIFRDDQTWVPIEITLVKDGFLKAWQIGAKEWRETTEAGSEGFYPVRKSWEIYEPVGFAHGAAAAVLLPDSGTILAEYRQVMDKFITREIGPRVDSLKSEIRKNRTSVSYTNKLGILYAQFGLYDQAEAEFKTVLRSLEYLPTLVNLGNIYYLKNNMTEAQNYYRRALNKDPGNTKALLGMARASYEANDYEELQNSLAVLAVESPETASRFSYLGSGSADSGRASQALEKAVNEWEEE